jgi:hypothetical protein
MLLFCIGYCISEDNSASHANDTEIEIQMVVLFTHNSDGFGLCSCCILAFLAKNLTLILEV